MYLRAVHAEPDVPTLVEFIWLHPLGLLTTALPSTAHPLLQHTHIPWLLDPPSKVHESNSSAEAAVTRCVPQSVSERQQYRLRGHMARANPHARALIEAARASALIRNTNVARHEGLGKSENEVTILFSASPQHYITPTWYVDTRPDTGEVVPTWNYASVEVRGRITHLYHDVEDTETDKFLQRALEDLVKESETNLVRSARKDAHLEMWKLDETPKAYQSMLKKEIIGIEIEVESIVGKFKMSQELAAGDRQGVLQGLRGMQHGDSKRVADMVQQRTPVVD